MRKITTRMGVALLVPEKHEKHPNAGRPKGVENVMTRDELDARGSKLAPSASFAQRNWVRFAKKQNAARARNHRISLTGGATLANDQF